MKVDFICEARGVRRPLLWKDTYNEKNAIMKSNASRCARHSATYIRYASSTTLESALQSYIDKAADNAVYLAVSSMCEFMSRKAGHRHNNLCALNADMRHAST
eukprot:scaffold15580_cov24-Prasinocladus_malaysianus.AAC.1